MSPIRSALYYTAVCDGCGKADDYEDVTAWSDEATALDQAANGDWCTEGDHLVCYDCRDKPAHLAVCGKCATDAVEITHDIDLDGLPEQGPPTGRQHEPGFPCPVAGCQQHAAVSA